VSARRFALVAGGGTAGHLQPALAVARALVAGHGPASVEMVGSRRGLERAVLADSGLPLTLLPGRGLSRRVAPGALVDNVVALAGLALATLEALVVVARRRPRVVVAVGGYASVPVALAAVVLGVPMVLVNVDAVPGAANRLVGRFAKAVAVAWPGTSLAHAAVTGAPVRPEVLAAVAPGAARSPGAEPDPAARAALGVPVDRLLVAAVGGSLGARRVNEAVLALAGAWAHRDDLALYHVVGRRDADWVAKKAPVGPGGRATTGALWYRQVPYEDHMERLYSAADVVVSRAGGMTVAEIALIGVPAVLVPLPGAPGDHQTANACVLVDAGAAVLVADAACTGARLAAEIEALASEPGRLGAMAKAAAALGRPDATAAIAELVDEHARPAPGPAVAA
jgi:UDP-N-acetylglucosamine:LPS N-acetylglucosamine transferase